MILELLLVGQSLFNQPITSIHFMIRPSPPLNIYFPYYTLYTLLLNMS